MENDANHSDDRLTDPLAVAIRTSITALTSIAIAAAFVFWRYRNLLDNVTWWAVALLPCAIVIVCFAYAYTGSRLGARRANSVFVVALSILLVAGIYFLTRTMDVP